MSSVFFYEPFYDLDRFLDDALSYRQLANTDSNQVARRSNDNSSNDGAVRPLRPRMDLHEDKDKNLVTATFEMPGLKKDDVNISIDNNRLTVSGESQISSDYDQNGYAVRERRFGNFSRTLQLPQGIKEDQIKAKMDSGVLSVTFPKASAEQTPKKITVN
ncbi:small heat shock protein [Coprinopsis marcescibilis]|uniref:Small heat shock protein n=1 Tax=Coprinopsis marcescibilis TaxID=230819 RepID=A0A5C3LC53_COPMA|nr:small heat shock protein [Coprinopsis marcescibilis]